MSAAKFRSKRRHAVFVGLILVAFGFAFAIDLPAYLRATPYLLSRWWPKPYDGAGTVFSEQIDSHILKQGRDVIVYLPCGYEAATEPLPLIIALHGHGSDESAFGVLLPSFLDQAIRRGDLSPVVMAAPDLSLGGTRQDRPETDYDDRAGSFYINSNLGCFEDYFRLEFLPWLFTQFNVSRNPEDVVLLGSSMGGFGAFSIGLRYPEISRILVGIYPAIDLRYSGNGSRIADYDPQTYAPIIDDMPHRPVMSALAGLLKKTEADLLYPVFDSDERPGKVWREDLAVWERVRTYNPTDLLRSGRHGDISGTAMYLIAGDRDEYNADAQVLSFIAKANELGSHVDPLTPIRKGGHHTPYFVARHLPEILLWIGEKLRDSIQSKTSEVQK